MRRRNWPSIAPGVLSTGLKQWKEAETYLSDLAGLDYGYKDVAERLDKLSSIRDD